MHGEVQYKSISDSGARCRVMKDARIHNVTRSNNLWASIKVVVDASTPTAALEAVGAAVHATIKANPKWYGGSYRVWWMDALPGAKVELGIFYDYSINGARRAAVVYSPADCSILHAKISPYNSGFFPIEQFLRSRATGSAG